MFHCATRLAPNRPQAGKTPPLQPFARQASGRGASASFRGAPGCRRLQRIAAAATTVKRDQDRTAGGSSTLPRTPSPSNAPERAADQEQSHAYRDSTENDQKEGGEHLHNRPAPGEARRFPAASPTPRWRSKGHHGSLHPVMRTRARGLSAEEKTSVARFSPCPGM